MTIQLSAFRWVPPLAQGYVKDLRVRWALEEAGLPYEAILIDGAVQGSAAYRQWQPFGQVPAYRDDQVELFESGAIVLHIAARSAALAPQDAAGRARASCWVLAALNSVEPPVQAVLHGEPAETRLDGRLGALTEALAGKDYLEGGFTAGDLMMTTVLRELVDTGILARFPTLEVYRRRCEARPAFDRAMEAHMRPFRDARPPSAPTGS